MQFEWDETKDEFNKRKHCISFYTAQYAFADPNRIIAEDLDHSTKSEKRYCCIGKVDSEIVTLRFTVRGNKIRIIGAGYWRKGRKIYEKENG